MLYVVFFFCKTKASGTESELVLEKYLYSNTVSCLYTKIYFLIDINISYVLHQGPLSINSFTNIKP